MHAPHSHLPFRLSFPRHVNQIYFTHKQVLSLSHSHTSWLAGMQPARWQKGGCSESGVCVCVVGLGWARQREPTAPSRLPPAPPSPSPDVRDSPGMFHKPAERWLLVPRDWGHFLPDVTHSSSSCPTVALKDRRGMGVGEVGLGAEL